MLIGRQDPIVTMLVGVYTVAPVQVALEIIVAAFDMPACGSPSMGRSLAPKMEQRLLHQLLVHPSVWPMLMDHSLECLLKLRILQRHTDRSVG